MARQKAPDPPEDDVPGWVMTFSDVITLLMTFFILLLTFATNQPETFDRMQVAAFGGGGSTGIAGKTDGMEKDSLLMRSRARTGRRTQQGSEMPPIYSDPALETLDGEIAGLEDAEQRVLSTTHELRFPLKMILSPDGGLTTVGAQRLKMIALQLRKMPLRVEIMVASEGVLDKALEIAEHMTDIEAVPQPAVGVGVAAHLVEEEELLLILDLQKVYRGA